MNQDTAAAPPPTTSPAHAPGAKADARTFQQDKRGESPWPLSHRIKTALWRLVEITLFATTPKPLNAWRLFILRRFGAQIEGTPYIDASCTIKYPWHLTIGDLAAIGPKADIYNLAHITIERGAVVAQQVYLCTGTHDLDDPKFPLVTAPIVVGENAFVGVRALVMPGLTVAKGAVVGGGAVVVKNVPEWTVVGGNPAKPIKQRTPIEGFGVPA
ncbi:MAG: putative colanic acid biosynthesis acetyltransferase [Planctomycetota bacterium]